MAAACPWVLLAVSVALNLYLWRTRGTQGDVPQEAIDQIHQLSAELDAATAKLKAAEEANAPTS